MVRSAEFGMLHRSWLFVPASVPRFIEKARGLDVDVVILDLEDGVPPNLKSTARAGAAECLATGEFGPRRYVRINPSGSEWFRDDIEAVCGPNLDGVVLPKVEDPMQVRQAMDLIRQSGPVLGWDASGVALAAAIETARGLIEAPRIAASDPAVTALLFGAEDYSFDLGLSTRRRGEASRHLYARSALVVAAVSAGVSAVDGVYPQLEDAAGLEEDIRLAKELGFAGKTLFHPSQVEAINRGFLPSRDEALLAEEIVERYEEAEKEGAGAVAVRGQLIDRPILLRARATLHLAETRGFSD